MTKMLLALLVGFAACAALMPVLIPILHKLKFGQSILEDGPVWHKKKQGIPTMGGIGFISASLLCAVLFLRTGRAWLVVLTALSFGLIGFLDDFIKVVKKHNKGLSARQKLVLQTVVSAAFLVSMTLSDTLSTKVWVPLVNVSLEFSWFFYPFAIFITVGFVNAVNLTDGLDGLASCVTVPVCLFFGAVGILVGGSEEGVFASALVGALLGFLVFNFYPAKVFMGDTGSLFLGGAVCALAFCANMPLVLLLVGLIYLLEALSDIIQVTYYKRTHRRIFKMAPIHHHFELCGWSEQKIVLVFSSITAVMCVVAYLAVIWRYV